MAVHDVMGERHSGDYVEVGEATLVQDLVEVVSREGGFGASHYCQILTARYIDLTELDVQRVLNDHSVFRNRGGRGQPAWYVRDGLVDQIPGQRGVDESTSVPSVVGTSEFVEPTPRPMSRKAKHLKFMLECAQEQLQDAAYERAHLLDQAGRLEVECHENSLIIQDLEDDLLWLTQENGNLLYELQRGKVAQGQRDAERDTMPYAEAMEQLMRDKTAALADAIDECAAAVTARNATLQELSESSQRCLSMEKLLQEQNGAIADMTEDRDVVAAQARKLEGQLEEQQRVIASLDAASEDLRRQLVFHKSLTAELEERIHSLGGEARTNPGVDAPASSNPIRQVQEFNVGNTRVRISMGQAALTELGAWMAETRAK